MPLKFDTASNLQTSQFGKDLARLHLLPKKSEKTLFSKDFSNDSLTGQLHLEILDVRLGESRRISSNLVELNDFGNRRTVTT